MHNEERRVQSPDPGELTPWNYLIVPQRDRLLRKTCTNKRAKAC
jgi:hypothetical protein